MRAARLHSYDEDHLHVDDVPEPEIAGPHEVIVRVGGAALCGTDLHTCGVCPACRRGEDMYCANGAFTGLNAEGGFAQYLRTSERACIKLEGGLQPKDVAIDDLNAGRIQGRGVLIPS
jgi:NAD+-dependent secondary alcohol dehydrogenase Adh1